MPEIVNLNKARKAKARADKEGQAAASRTRFGRTKVEKAREKAETAKAERLLDGARVDRPDDGR